MAKLPLNWPKGWKLKLEQTGRWREPEHNVFDASGAYVANVYKARHGWGYTSSRYGEGGKGLRAFATRHDALEALATSYQNVESAKVGGAA